MTVVSARKAKLRTIHKLRSIRFKNVLYQWQRNVVPFTAPAVTKILTNSYRAMKVKRVYFLLGFLLRHGIALFLKCT